LWNCRGTTILEHTVFCNCVRCSTSVLNLGSGIGEWKIPLNKELRMKRRRLLIVFGYSCRVHKVGEGLKKENKKLVAHLHISLRINRFKEACILMSSFLNLVHSVTPLYPSAKTSKCFAKASFSPLLVFLLYLFSGI